MDDPADALTFDIGHALRRAGALKGRDRQDEVARQVIAHLRDRGWRIGRKSLNLDAYRRLSNEARSSLRMIREAVELHAPAGSIAAEERVEPPLTAEAEVLVNGILKLAGRA